MPADGTMLKLWTMKMQINQQRIKQWLKTINSKEPGKSERQKFRDFCEMAYCTFAKLTALSQEDADALEDRYMRVVNTYQDKDAVRLYPGLLETATIAVNEGEDFLGVIASQINALDARQGQFFTPVPVCRLMAKMNLFDASRMIDEHGYITFSDPCAGSGAIILAYA